MIRLPEKVKNLIDVLRDAGYEAFAVGGCVRDSLLGREPNDWDLCTSATPEEMKSVFGDAAVTTRLDGAGEQDAAAIGGTGKGGATDAGTPARNQTGRKIKVIETGLQHGTLTILLEGEAFEITTYRIDGDYSDGRRPDDVTFIR